MKDDIENIDAECCICDWAGIFEEMEQPTNEDDVHKCPICGSEDIYYFKQPPRHNGYN